MHLSLSLEVLELWEESVDSWEDWDSWESSMTSHDSSAFESGWEFDVGFVLGTEM